MTSLDVAKELHSRYNGSMEKMLRDVMKVRDADVLARKAAELLNCEPASLASKKTPEQWEPVVKKLISWKMVDRNMMRQAEIDSHFSAKQIDDSTWEVSVDDGLMKEAADLYSQLVNRATGSQAAAEIVNVAAQELGAVAEAVKSQVQKTKTEAMKKRADALSASDSPMRDIEKLLNDAKQKRLGPNAKTLVDASGKELEEVKKLTDELKRDSSLERVEKSQERIRGSASLSEEEKKSQLAGLAAEAEAYAKAYEKRAKEIADRIRALNDKLKPLDEAMSKQQ